MAEEKKKKGFLSRFGLKSKDEKRAEEAAQKAAEQKRVDEQMAARMAAINAAALKSAREMDAQKSSDDITEISAEEQARQEAEDKRQAEIQAAKDVARAKQLAEERANQTALDAEREAKAKAAKIKAEEEAKALAAKQAQEAQERAEAQRLEKERFAAEEAAQKAKEDAAIKAAKDAQEAAALKAQAEAAAKAREEIEAQRRAEIIRQEETAKLAAIAEAKRLKDAQDKADEAARLQRMADEAKEAERRARIAEERATREANEREALAKIKAEREAKLEAEGKLAPKPDQNADDSPSNFLARISKGLSKSTSRMSESMAASFTKRTLDDAAIEDLEDILIASDLGTGPALKVTSRLAQDKFDKQITDLEIKIALADVISEILTPLEKPIVLGAVKPQILLFVGVNGSGKTTTLGKIAKRFTDDGKKVLIAAGDTFRAAAFEQLSVWGERANAPVMSGKVGADAAGLVYDAIERARDENFDILMIDTAGRLQNRTELMDELAKVLRVIKKQDETAPHHSILVLDATVGQNALMQTEAFAKTAEVSGLIMTKLDGTAKGGVLVALSDKYNLPIHCIGIGEQVEDLENFSAPVFAAALSGVADEMRD